jgi:hypothetical protein
LFVCTSVLVGVLAGCGSGGAPTSHGTDAAARHVSRTATQPGASLAAGVVADVGTAQISVADLNHAIEVTTGRDFFQIVKVKAPTRMLEMPMDRRRCISDVTTISSLHVGNRRSAVNPTTICEKLSRAIEQEALNNLITFQWLVGQAAEEGVIVTEREVAEAFDRARAREFPTQAQLASFLRDRDITLADEVQIYRWDVLSTKLVRRLEELGGKDAYAHYQTEATAAWTAKTTCAPQYVTEGCSEYRTPSSPEPSPEDLIEAIA